MNSCGPTFSRRRLFSLLAYHLAKLPMVLLAREQAAVDFAAKRFVDRATVIGLHVGDARVVTRSDIVSNLTRANTLLMLRGEHFDPGVLTNSVSKLDPPCY